MVKIAKISNTIYDMQEFIYWSDKENDYFKAYLRNPAKDTLINIVATHQSILKYKKETLQDTFLIKIVNDLIKKESA